AGKLKDWIKHNYRFVTKEFGQENIVRFAMHADEKTPHIHATVVPLTADGRLSAKEYLFGHKEKLRGFQDRYAKAMQGFGLERGLAGRRTPHTTTAEYYRNQEHAAKVALPEIKPLERRHGLLGMGGKESYYEVEKRALDSFVLAQRGWQERGERKAKMDELVLKRVQRDSKKWEKMANELADVVDDRDTLLRSVGKGETSPQQITEAFDEHEKRLQQQEAEKQEQQRRGRGRGMSM
ncbi:MAG: MobV family relaxase, partial [Rivularia sp. (in: cyanobacteria)]